MNQLILKTIEKFIIRKQNFDIGDTIHVHYKIIEGDVERVQIFSGIVIRTSGSYMDKTFTVRRYSYKVGVERIFPLQSPRIIKIEVLKKAKIRRAKLYYLRERTGKKAKLRERKIFSSKNKKSSQKVEKQVKKTEQSPSQS